MNGTITRPLSDATVALSTHPHKSPPGYYPEGRALVRFLYRGQVHTPAAIRHTARHEGMVNQQ